MTDQKTKSVYSNLNMKIESSITVLPDDLVLKILSFLSTKHAVATSLMSKRWKSLWTMVPRLKYCTMFRIAQDHSNDFLTSHCLRAHQSHLLESLYFTVDFILWNKDIGPWIRTALHHHHCHLRELEIDACLSKTLLPPELFTCKTLVVLPRNLLQQSVFHP